MLTGWQRTVSRLFIIPQRYVLGVMGLLAVCNAYIMRMCLNVAITQMVFASESSNNSTAVSDSLVCPADEGIGGEGSSRPHALFDWSESTQGLLLSAFYYGYALTQVPGGMLSERYGGKWVLGVGLLSTAIFTLLTPVVVKAGGAVWLFILRLLQGMGEGPTMPALMIVLSRWIPPAERSTQGALVFGGAQIGNILGSYVSGLIMADGGLWDNVFYLFGCTGILWFILWSLLCYSTPHSHPYISEKELKFLEENVDGDGKTGRRDPTPWKAILRSWPVWALLWAAVGHDWGYYTMVTDLPKYMTDVLKYDIAQTGTLSALPYAAMWVASFIFGAVCDICVRKKWHSIKTGRIIHTTIAATGPAITIILASYAGCDRTAAVAYFIVSMALMGGFYSGMKVNAMDIAPNFAGSVTAMVNGTSTISGIITPYLVGLLTPNQTLLEWRVAFWINFAILVGTNIIYIFGASGSQQWWDDVNKHGYPDSWKHGPLKKPDVNPEDAKEKKEANS